MPSYLLICLDKPASGERRAALRPDHLAFIAGSEETVLLAGPMLDDEGAPMGSLLVIEAADKTAAQAFAEADPYARGGLFASVEIRPYRPVTGALLK